jgi:hypothetical protein
MQLAISNQFAVNFAGARGLAYDQTAYNARPGLFDVANLIALDTSVTVKAGEETPVPVQVQNLKPNANILHITAELTISDPGPEPPQTSTVSVTQNGGNPSSFGITLDSTPGLRNVQVRLQGGPVLWNHAGVAPPGPYDIPDFAAQANAYLDQAKIIGNGVTFQFLVKSETAGTVQISINPNLDFVLLQTQSWKNSMDSTIRLDRNLQLDYNSVEELPLEDIATPGAIKRSQIRFDAGGKFDPGRLLGEVTTFDGRQAATISSDYSLAQNFQIVSTVVKKGIQCSGISAYFQSDSPADLYFELQTDATGSPGNAMPLASANVPYKPPEKGAPQLWTFAAFLKPAELSLDTIYWVVIKAVRGTANLGLQISSPDPSHAVSYGPALINRGGDRWKCLAISPKGRGDSCSLTLRALAGIVYLPGLDNQTAAIHALVGNTPAEQRFDAAAKPLTISLGLTGITQKQAVLIIRSHARGMLTLANVIQEYKLP